MGSYRRRDFEVDVGMKNRRLGNRGAVGKCSGGDRLSPKWTPFVLGRCVRPVRDGLCFRGAHGEAKLFPENHAARERRIVEVEWSRPG